MASSACNITPIDIGDPNSVAIAQLDTIKCQILTSQIQHADTLEAIKHVSNLTSKNQQLIVDAIARIAPASSLSVTGAVIYTLVTALIILFLKLLCSVVWYVIIQRFDSVAECVLYSEYLWARWRDPHNPVNMRTLEEFRTSRPVPILLVFIKCCACKQLPDRRDVYEM